MSRVGRVLAADCRYGTVTAASDWVLGKRGAPAAAMARRLLGQGMRSVVGLVLISTWLPAQAPRPPLGPLLPRAVPTDLEHVPPQPRSGPVTSCGWGCGGPNFPVAEGFAGEFWLWNRTRWLRERAAPVVAGERHLGAEATVAADPTQTWLLALLAAPEAWVRAGAARALGAGGDLAAAGSKLAADPEPAVRVAWVQALGDDGSPAARFQLERLLASPAGPDDLRPMAAVALAVATPDGTLGAGPPGLRSALERGGSPELRAALFAAVGRCRSAAAQPAVRSELLAAAPSVALAPALASVHLADRADLTWLRVLAGSGASEHLAVLANVAGSGVPGAGAFVVGALANPRGGPEAAEQWFAAAAHVDAGARLLAAVADGQKYQRGTVALALAVHAVTHDAVASRGAILAALRDTKSGAQRPALLLAAGLIGHPLAGLAARARLEDGGRGEEALAAVDALGLIGDADAVATLWWVLQNHGDAAVQAAACDVLARADPGAFAAACTSGSSPWKDEVRPAALVALGRTRARDAGAVLRGVVGDARRPLRERQAALVGIAHWRRRTADSPWDRYAAGVAFTWLPTWLLQRIRAVS